LQNCVWGYADMDIKGLHYFISAAERLNFTAAAKDCYITQTAMSLHIRKMEEELGFQLFVRDKRKAELTAAGQNFYEAAKGLTEQFDKAVAHAINVSKGYTGFISITLPGSYEGFILTDKIKAFTAQYPKVEVSISVEAPGKHMGDVRSGRTDICIGSPDDMGADTDFAVEFLREDPIFVACNKKHRFAGLNKVSVEMLRDEPVILCDPKELPVTFRAMRTGKMQVGVYSETLINVKNIDEMLLQIELERGIAFLPAFSCNRLASDSSNLAFIRCEENGRPLMMTTALGYLKNNLNPVLRNFVSFLLQK